jgi:hypothetical protein
MLQAAQKAYHKAIDPGKQAFMGATGLEPATSGVTEIERKTCARCGYREAKRLATDRRP